MYVTGQALLNYEPPRQHHRPAELRSVAVVPRDDTVIRPLLDPFVERRVLVKQIGRARPESGSGGNRTCETFLPPARRTIGKRCCGEGPSSRPGRRRTPASMRIVMRTAATAIKGRGKAASIGLSFKRGEQRSWDGVAASTIISSVSGVR